LESSEQGNESGLPEGALYGITIMQMDDDRPQVVVAGKPDLGQLQRLLSVALSNLQADIIAQRVVMVLEDQRKQQRIIRPGE
jgi:hypothetical protein